MIKNRTGIPIPVPETGVCDRCEEEFPWFETIRTIHHGRLCDGCHVIVMKKIMRDTK